MAINQSNSAGGCLAPVFLQFYRGRILTNPRMKRIPFFLFLFFLKFLYNILTWMINERQGSTSWRPAAQFIINKCCNPIKSFSIVPHYQSFTILSSIYIVFTILRPVLFCWIFSSRFVLSTGEKPQFNEQGPFPNCENYVYRCQNCQTSPITCALLQCLCLTAHS